MVRNAVRRAGLILLASILGASSATAAKYLVQTSNTDHAAIAQAIGGDLVETYTPHKGFMEPELTWVDEILPSWIMKARRADMYVRYGLFADVWADTVIEASRNEKIEFGAPGHLDPTAHIMVLEIPTGAVDRRMGEVHLFGNPHFLLDPANAIPVARAIAERMSEIWPDHREQIATNLENFLSQLDSKMKEWEQKAAPLRGRLMATYHRTWSYFTERYGLKVVGIVEPKPGIEPTPADVSKLIRAMKADHTPILVKAPVFSDEWPEYVVERVGYPVKIVTLAAHVGGDDGVESYFDLFDYLIDGLLKAYGEG